MISIDGSQGEGGGQILRTASALAALLNKPCKIFNIRSKRPNPGLKQQHLQGLLAVSKLCNGRLENAKIGSTEIEFYPGELFSNKLEINIPTAGAITLVLQSLMIPAAFSKEKTTIKIKGGATNTAWSPPIDFTRNIFFPIIKKMGYVTELDINKRGFYPTGGADVSCNLLPPGKLNGLDLQTRGNVKTINGLSICSNLPQHVAERQRKSAESVLQEAGYDFNITDEIVKSSSAGSALVLWAECNNSIIGADSLGEIKKSAEVVGKEAATRLIKELESGSALDIHTTDQLIPYLALGKGKSIVTTSKITSHTLTNINIAEKFLDIKFSVEENFIEVEGLGFKTNSKTI